METQQNENQPVNQDGQQDAGQSAQNGNQQGQPFRVFSSQEELDKFMGERAKRAERKALNTQARTLGYDDWQEMQDALQAIRKTPANTETSTDSPAQQADPGKGEVDRLRMALTVAGELNLPAALIGRLQGDTVDAMKADAELLLGLFGQTAQRPAGFIPPVPQGNQPVTFTKTQLSNAEFVRTHKEEILKASREGRIVMS